MRERSYIRLSSARASSKNKMRSRQHIFNCKLTAEVCEKATIAIFHRQMINGSSKAPKSIAKSGTTGAPHAAIVTLYTLKWTPDIRLPDYKCIRNPLNPHSLLPGIGQYRPESAVLIQGDGFWQLHTNAEFAQQNGKQLTNHQ